MRSVLARTMMLVVGVVLAPAFAEAGCDEPMNQSEMNMCAAQEYREADAALNLAYKEAMAGLNEQHEMVLRDAQRAWIAFRDLACESYGHQADGGSMQPMLVNGCLARLTKERTQMLIEQGATN